MADTVDLDEIEEFSEAPHMLDSKVQALAKLIKKSKHTLVFTGAGISTASKIPDFRGPEGVWTRKAQGRAPPACISMEAAEPTYSHNALVTLVQKRMVKYVVSQNVDGLHRRSGLEGDQISELHGNCYLEVCWKCDAEYIQNYDVSRNALNRRQVCAECRKRVPFFCHCLKRKCDGCGARLKDSIIHFKENLPQRALKRAFHHGAKADLVIVLGSSLRVSPACEVPMESVKRGGKLVIVNLQATPYDDDAALLVHAKIDEVFTRLMPLLKVAVDANGKALGATSSSAAGASAAGATSAASTSASTGAGAGAGAGSATTAVTAPVAAAAAAGAPAAAAVVCDDVDLVVVNTHRRVDSATDASDGGVTHEWGMEVRAQSGLDVETAVHHVVYTLHPTFQQPIVTVREAPFRLVRRGWGTFEVGVKVFLRSDPRRAALTASHMLSFAAPESPPTTLKEL